MTRPISLILVVSNKRLVYWFTLERPFFVEMKAKNRALCVCEWRRYLPCLSRQRCQMYAYRESETKHKSGFYSGWLSFFRPSEIHWTHFFMSKQYFFLFRKEHVRYTKCFNALLKANYSKTVVCNVWIWKPTNSYCIVELFQH